jgi:DNA-directed RNA polymerase specialized sigma24 family protein
MKAHKYGSAPDEVLAVAHLRQWAHDKMRMRGARTSHNNYLRPGWSTRSNARADASIVRCIDFENCLAELEPLEQTILVWIYRDGMTRANVAIAAGCCERTVHGRTAEARRKLARALDRKGLL